MKIEEASPKEISEYLQYIVDTADKISLEEVSNGIRGNHEVWEEAYDIIFSSTVSDVIHERFPDFHPDVPDTTYIEDVTAYVRDFKVYAEDDERRSKYFMSFDEFSNKELENE